MVHQRHSQQRWRLSRTYRPPCKVLAPNQQKDLPIMDNRQIRTAGGGSFFLEHRCPRNNLCHAPHYEGRARSRTRSFQEKKQAVAALQRKASSLELWCLDFASPRRIEACLDFCCIVLDRKQGKQKGQLYVNGSTTRMGLDSLTGGAIDFKVATKPLTHTPLSLAKKIVLVRHGLSSWNEDNRIQGSSDLSILSDKGEIQVQKCKNALGNFKFDQCFASPISRAKSSAELIWKGRKEPLLFLDTLREANLRFLEGMRNVDARQQFPDTYKAWREDPANFHIDGAYPVVELWGKAKKAWEEILSAQGETVLVVTHKSILRALICTALGMGPDRFRSIDINNGGISIFIVNSRGETMLQSLNLTAHLQIDGVRY